MPEHCLRQVELGMYHVPERIDLCGGVDLGGPTPLINPSLVVCQPGHCTPLSLQREVPTGYFGSRPFQRAMHSYHVLGAQPSLRCT